MDNQKIVLESLAMDLKRAALGLHQGSPKMAEVFMKGALGYKKQAAEYDLDPYMVLLLKRIEDVLKNHAYGKSDDLLMYGTLVQNFVLKFIH